MVREKSSLDIGSATGNTAAVDVSNCSVVTVFYSGITGGGSVTLQISGDGGATWQNYSAANTSDGYDTITDLVDQIRINVGTAKAGATAYVKKLVSTTL